jgi:methylase of polypeptide subunit release factors
MVEVGIDQAEAVASLARAKGFVQVAIVADMGRIPRVVVGRLA